MARKSAKLTTKKVGRRFEIPKVKLTTDAKEFIHRMQQMGHDVREGQEESAFARFIEATVRHESAWAYWTSLGDDPKDEDVFKAVAHEVARTSSALFQAFDGWQYVRKNTITVPVAEIRQIVYDALMANVDAMPDNFRELDGLERGREFKRIADDLIEAFKSDRVRVTEEATDVPYCDDCEAELS